MQIKEYKQLDEVLYTEELDNGLTVQLLPKPDYNKTYALFSTDFGSIDQHFIPLGKEDAVKVPDGIAHFLEHKLFEKEDGDVFHDFSKYGASANAYTGFTTTAYLFSSTDYVKENLKILLDFVQDPYFTKETVEKEKGIIGQEIQMYDDHPDWRLMFGLLENLYPNHPASIDIAGTVESIDKITHDMLYENYYTFYHPSNMMLFMVGNFDPEATLALIKENQANKTFAAPEPIQRFLPEENIDDIISENSIQMDILKPKATVGMRGKMTDLIGEEGLKYQLAINLFLDLVFGNSSKNYLKLYDEEIIDDSFGYGLSYQRDFNYLNISCDTQKDEEFVKRVKAILLDGTENDDFNQSHFEEIKKATIGKYIQSLNSLDAIASQFTATQDNELNLFDALPVLENITLEDVKVIVDNFIDEKYLSTFKVLPK